MAYQNKQSYILAKQNLNLAQGLLKNKKYYDLVVTALYYSALMLAHALYEIRSWPIPTQHRTAKDQIGWNQSIGDLIDTKTKINSVKSYISGSSQEGRLRTMIPWIMKNSFPLQHVEYTASRIPYTSYCSSPGQKYPPSEE